MLEKKEEEAGKAFHSDLHGSHSNIINYKSVQLAARLYAYLVKLQNKM